jgi:hypothetical protein
VTRLAMSPSNGAPFRGSERFVARVGSSKLA